MSDKPILIYISPGTSGDIIEKILMHINHLSAPLLIDVVPEKKVDIDDVLGEFRLDLARIPDILCDNEADKSREHYKKVTAPPPPWKKR